MLITKTCHYFLNIIQFPKKHTNFKLFMPQTYSHCIEYGERY